MPRILILDDVVSTRIVLKARLVAAAHEVAQAVTAEEARAALAQGGFGLAILAGSFAAPDWAEPFCRELGRRPPPAPRVLVLGPGAGDDGDSAARLRLLAAGAAGYLPARIDAVALLAHLRALLRQQPAGAHALERASLRGPLQDWSARAGRAAGHGYGQAPGFGEAGAALPAGWAPRPEQGGGWRGAAGDAATPPGRDFSRGVVGNATGGAAGGATGKAPGAGGGRGAGAGLEPSASPGAGARFGASAGFGAGANPEAGADSGTGAADGSEAAAAACPVGEPAGGWLALVSARPQAAVVLRAQLGRTVPQRLTLFRPEELLPALRSGPLPDAVLILTGTDHPGAGAGRPAPATVSELHLLAELRARAATSRTPVLVLGAAGPEVPILALDLGAQDVLPGGFTAEELALRLRQCLARAREHDHERDRHQRELAEELRLASTDALTGLANRRACLRGLDALHGAAGAGLPYALLLVDIDRFKQVNDTWGHAAGDRVLAALAARLAAALVRGDLLGRLGGEEFLIALPGATLSEARAAADALRRTVEAAPFPLECGAEVWVTVSIGLCLPDPGQPVQQAMAAADRALYAAKARGRNRVWIGRPAA